MLAVAPIHRLLYSWTLYSSVFCFKITTLHLSFSISHDHGFIFTVWKFYRKILV